jgi:hypothetical protein
MCNNTCNKCHQCTDICTCRAKLEPCATTACKEKISTDCVWYKFGNQASMSKLLCFLGVSNNTNLTTILEKLDERLCPLFHYHPSACARQLLGLPATTDILFIIEKLLNYICTATDEKVKVTPTDRTGGYLNDKIDLGDCLVKTVIADLTGNQKLRISIDFNCLKSKIPTCIEVNCTNCTPVTPISPVAPSPVVTPVTPTAPSPVITPVVPTTPTTPVVPSSPTTPVVPNSPVTPVAPTTPVGCILINNVTF